MSRKIVKYITAIGFPDGTHSLKLDFSVSSLIEGGYQPYGSPYSHGDYACQAMVKYEE